MSLLLLFMLFLLMWILLHSCSSRAVAVDVVAVEVFAMNEVFDRHHLTTGSSQIVDTIMLNLTLS